MSPKRWCSFWNGPCLGDMLVLRGVLIGSKMNWKGACLVMLRCPGVLNPGYKRWDERCQACVFYSCFFFGVFQAFKDSTNKKRHDFFPQPPSKRKIAGRKPRSNRVVENHWVAQPQPVLITYTSLVELWIKGMESCPLLNIEKNSNDHPYNECELHS